MQEIGSSLVLARKGVKKEGVYRGWVGDLYKHQTMEADFVCPLLTGHLLCKWLFDFDTLFLFLVSPLVSSNWNFYSGKIIAGYGQ